MSNYKVCDKCGVRHSTLVRHKCFKPEPQKDPPKFDNPPPGDGEAEQGQDTSDNAKQKPDQGDSENDGQGDDQEGGDNEGEGEGEGESQGEGQAEGQAEAPPPEPEIPPAAVVVTVLKYAALTAASRQFLLTVELTEDGLLLKGWRGQRYYERTIPWGEFEKRSTLDGEMYVRGEIEEVELALNDGELIEVVPESVEFIEANDIGDEDDWEEDERGLPKEPLAEIDWDEPIEFVANGEAAQVWGQYGENTRVGIINGEGCWLLRKKPDERKALRELVADASIEDYMADVDQFGCLISGKNAGKPFVRNA